MKLLSFCLCLCSMLATSVFAEPSLKKPREGLRKHTEPLPVQCQAIDIENRQRTNNPHEPLQHNELIVVGTIKLLKKGKFNNLYRLEIKEILYGDHPTKSVIFSARWLLEENKEISRIVALAPDLDRQDQAPYYLYKYSLPLTEKAPMAALSKAMFSEKVLSSTAIFIGQELSSSENGICQVNVKSTIYGPSFKKNKTIQIKLGRGTIKASKQPTIYFVNDIELAEEEQATLFNIIRTTNLYHVSSRLPVTLVNKVRNELKNRKTHPIIHGKIYVHKRNKEHYREIFFQGTPQQAISFLGSNSKAAVHLAKRYLQHNQAETKELVLNSIKVQLLTFPTQKPDQFNQLHQLIKLYSSFRHKNKNRDLIQLIEQYLTHVESGAKQPPTPKRRYNQPFHQYEEQNYDVNHSLTWLIEEIPTQAISEKLIRRLLKLRDQSTGQWKAEIQLALDVKKIEDTIELQAALKKSTSLPTTRLAILDKQTASKLNYDANQSIQTSPDGKLIFTYFEPGFVDVRDANTLALIKRNTLKINTRFSSFSPKGDGIFITEKIKQRGDYSSNNKFSFINATTGKTLSTFTLPTNNTLNWLKNNELLLLNYDSSILLNYSTGKIIKKQELDNTRGSVTNENETLLYSFEGGGKSTYLDIFTSTLDHKNKRKVGTIDLNWGCYANTTGLVPDGKSLYFGKPGVYIHDRKTLKLISGNQFRDRQIYDLQFSNSGSQYAALVTTRTWTKNNPSIYTGIIRVHDTYTGHTKFAFDQGATKTSAITFGPKGKKLYILKKSGILELRNLP